MADSTAAGFSGGRVQGTVVAADTGAPLAGAVVWLDRNADPDLSPRRKSVTDLNGAFAFERVRAGSYRLYAERFGYLTADYLQQRFGSEQQFLRIREGSDISDAQLSLQLGGKVSGTVWDEQGEPAFDMVVKLLSIVSTSDGLATTGVVTSRTNKNGGYYFEGLNPGHYVLRAERRTQPDGDARLEFAYYPDVASLQAAARLDINKGDAITDINMTFYPKTEQPIVTGSVVDAQTGAPIADVVVSLVEGSNVGIHTNSGADGRFELKGMTQGKYVISAQGEGVGEGYGWGLEKATLAAGPNEVNFKLSSAPRMEATVAYLGSAVPPARGDYMVSIRTDQNARGITYNGQNKFEFRGLPVGSARIAVGFSSLQYRVASIQVGGLDVTDQEIELQPGDRLTDVKILITDYITGAEGPSKSPGDPAQPR